MPNDISARNSLSTKSLVKESPHCLYCHTKGEETKENEEEREAEAEVHCSIVVQSVGVSGKDPPPKKFLETNTMEALRYDPAGKTMVHTRVPIPKVRGEAQRRKRLF